MKLGAIGECMLELSLTESLPNTSLPINTKLGFGGDTLNTLVYASKLGIDAFFFSAVGTDLLSQQLTHSWAESGVHTDFIVTIPDRLPGMYAIELDEQGERTFHYWRENSAATQLFAGISAEELYKALAMMDVVYLSGISLSILPESARYSLLNVLKRVKQTGKIIAFDGNYRPRNWPGLEQAKQAFLDFFPIVDWYLPTLDDEYALFKETDVSQTLKRLKQYHFLELVIKDGEHGARVIADGKNKKIPIPESVPVIDTTAAGDSFNAGYLAARLGGKDPFEAACYGHKTASVVIQHKGAIVESDEFKKIAKALSV